MAAELEWMKVKDEQPRLIMSLGGLEKCGKTHIALSAPDPIAFQNFDNGMEGVVNKFIQAGKKIHLQDYRDKAQVLKILTMNEAETKSHYSPIWTRFKADFLKYLEHKLIRSIVWDTGTEVWELARLAAFGKLDKVMPHHYGPLNSEFKALIDLAFSYDKNLIITHKYKKQYVAKGEKEVWNGKYEQAGYGGMGFLVQVVGRCFRDEEENFCLEIKDCRHNEKCNGKVYVGEECSFPWLAADVVEGTTPMDWGL